MATENIIPGQGSINIRYFYLGQGAFDCKLAVLNLTELNSLIAEVGAFYDDGNLVWVMSERVHYIINNDGAGNITAEIADIGSGSSTPVDGTGFLYYGGQQNVYDYNVTGLQSAKPSTVGYHNNDMVVSSGGVAGGVLGYEQYNTWRIEIDTFGEAYIFEGSIKGSDGLPGLKGDKGDKGEAFVVNGQGLLADRPACTTVPDGYSYLVTSGVDSGQIFFAIVPAGGNPCSWSAGAPFGKGDPGASVWTVFKRSTVKLIGGDQPSDSLAQEDVDNGWTDGVPNEDGNPATNDVLYLSQATYAVTDDTQIPVITDPATFTWTAPVLVEGTDGIDGKEGRDAGFWVVWSEQQDKPNDPINKPEKNLTTGEDTWVKDPGESWFDDIDAQDPAKDQPRWMAQSSYNISTDSWGPWVITQIGGEKPPYKLNLFAREAVQPAAVTVDLPYYSTNNDGTFTSGVEAAILANAAIAGSDPWSDSPPIETVPAPEPPERLWFIEVFVSLDGPNTNWTTPTDLDGKEGDEAGIWSVWNEANVQDVSGLPILQTANDIIDNENDTIDLSTSAGPPPWLDSSTVNAVWMANTYFRKGSWSAWQYMKVKGEKGDPGANFAINDQGSGPPTDSMHCTEEAGYSYLDEDTSLLYFKTTGPVAAPCTGVVWTSGTPFGKGSDGSSYFNLYYAGETAISKPADNVTKDDAISTTAWKDAPPQISGAQRLWITTTSYAVDSLGTPLASFSWSPAVNIDGDEGISAQIWTIWSTVAAPADPPPVDLNTGEINLSGTEWIDDTVAAGAPVIWMATSYYRPAKPGELPTDSKGWVWTTWVVVKVLGEDGQPGEQGNAAYTYIPSTLFNKQPSDTNIGLSNALGGCLNPDGSGGYVINMAEDGSGNNITIGGVPFRFEDGIPITTNDERVWMIQGVFNSNDHECGTGILNWGFATVLKDTGGIDYQYHRGDGSPATGKSGTKPANDPVGGGNPDANGWYDTPELVEANENDGAYWLGQKNWSEGPSAQWLIYQIRGSSGDDGTSPPVIEYWYSSLHPGHPDDPGQSNLGNPDTNPSYWGPSRITASTINYVDLSLSVMESYWVIVSTDGVWGTKNDLTPITKRHWGSMILTSGGPITSVQPEGQPARTDLFPYMRVGDKGFADGVRPAWMTLLVDPGDAIEFTPSPDTGPWRPTDASDPSGTGHWSNIPRNYGQVQLYGDSVEFSVICTHPYSGFQATYHSGTGVFPEVNDYLYEDSDGTIPFDGVLEYWSDRNTNNFYEVRGDGKVLDIANC